MVQSDPTHTLCGQRGVGHLEGHPDSQRQVREVGVVGGFAAEVDPALGLAVVEPRVAQDMDRVHRRPRERDAPYGQRGEQAAGGSGSVARLRKRECHGHETRGARADQDALRGDGRGVLGAGEPQVAAGSARRTPIQTQTMKTSAATSDAHKAATDHDAPFASAMTAAAQPQAAPAITRLAASPGRPIRAVGAPGSRARLTTGP